MLSHTQKLQETLFTILALPIVAHGDLNIYIIRPLRPQGVVILIAHTELALETRAIPDASTRRTRERCLFLYDQ